MIHPQNGVDTVLMLPLAAAAATAARTASWDTVQVDGSAKYAEIRIVISTEVTTDNTGPTISLLESDDTVVTNHATFDSNFELADTGVVAGKEIRYLVDLKGRKRYLRLTVTPETVATDDQIQFCAIGTLHRTGVYPGSTTDMGDDVVVIG